MTSKANGPPTNTSHIGAPVPDAASQTASKAAESPAPEGAPVAKPAPVNPAPVKPAHLKPAPLAPEIGGAQGPEPTRYGDWQHKGRVTDF